MHKWLGAYCAQKLRRTLRPPQAVVHVLLAVCDHYEPRWGNASEAEGHARVQTWITDYPKNLGGFRDCDGRPTASFSRSSNITRRISTT
jgi:hypothetical protein